MTSATDLAELGRRWRDLCAEQAYLRPLVHGAIRELAARGTKPTAIARIFDYSRDQVRQICLPPERQRRRGSDDRPTPI